MKKITLLIVILLLSCTIVFAQKKNEITYRDIKVTDFMSIKDFKPNTGYKFECYLEPFERGDESVRIKGLKLKESLDSLGKNANVHYKAQTELLNSMFGFDQLTEKQKKFIEYDDTLIQRIYSSRKYLIYVGVYSMIGNNSGKTGIFIDKIEGILTDEQLKQEETENAANNEKLVNEFIIKCQNELPSASDFKNHVKAISLDHPIMDCSFTDKILSPDWIEEYKQVGLIDKNTGASTTPTAVVSSPLYNSYVTLAFSAVANAIEGAQAKGVISEIEATALYLFSYYATSLALEANTADLKYTYYALLGSIGNDLLSNVDFMNGNNFGY